MLQWVPDNVWIAFGMIIIIECLYKLIIKKYEEKYIYFTYFSLTIIGFGIILVKMIKTMPTMVEHIIGYICILLFIIVVESNLYYQYKELIAEKNIEKANETKNKAIQVIAFFLVMGILRTIVYVLEK